MAYVSKWILFINLYTEKVQSIESPYFYGSLSLITEAAILRRLSSMAA